MPVWVRDKRFQHQQGSFYIPRTAIFQRRASFKVALVTVWSKVKAISAAAYVADSGRDISAQTEVGATKHTDSCGVAKQ